MGFILSSCDTLQSGDIVLPSFVGSKFSDAQDSRTLVHDVLYCIIFVTWSKGHGLSLRPFLDQTRLSVAIIAVSV